jgi:hypothetical protein
MTAEIVVMNRTAVAMAADSAITLPGGKKRFASATKLIAAHRSEPVGVMFYESPEFVGVPWDVIVYEFRTQCNSSFPTVKDYAEAFFEYLKKRLPIWSNESHLRALEDSLVTRLIRAIEEGWDRRVRSGNVKESTQEANTTVAQIVDTWLESRDRAPRVLGDDFGTGLAERINRLLGEIGYWTQQLSEETSGLMRKAATHAVSHMSPKETHLSGLVFAGFGTGQHFPSMCSYMLGVPAQGQQLRKCELRIEEISAERPARIIPFAQNQLIRLFMEGLDPGIRVFFDSQIRKLGERLEVGDEGIRKLQRDLDVLINSHGSGIIETISYLPKGELARFAQSLIEFTAFRQKVSMGQESVSEPIDVAVISRGDGFVWVRRSHYFPPELNPGFFRRYGGMITP